MLDRDLHRLMTPVKTTRVNSEPYPEAAVDQERHTCRDDAIGRLTDLVRPVEEVFHREEEFSCGQFGDRDRSPEHEVHHEEVAELQ